MTSSQHLKQINSVTESIKGEGIPWQHGGGASLFGVSQSDWELLFENLGTAKFRAEDLGTAFSALGGIAQEGFSLARQAIDLTASKENAALKEYQEGNDEKRKSLEKRLSLGLMSQAQYDAEIEKMEAEQEAREEELSIKQAQRNKVFSLVQSIINTALGVTKALATEGPFGIASAAIIGAIGAAQTAMIAAQPVTGREKGGAFDPDGRSVRVRRRQDGRTFPARLAPDRRGYIDRPTVLVGENGTEYVIPSEALQNPSVAPFVDAIETARCSGRLRDLRLDAVQPRLAVAGRAAGGFFDDAAADNAHGGVTMPDGTRLTAANYQEFLQLLRRMNTIFSKPIKAEVNYLGRHGIKEAEDDYARAQARGRLG